MTAKTCFITLLILVSGIAGCASGPTYEAFAPTIGPMSGDNGRIFFYRPSFVGAAVRPDVRLNGEVVGRVPSYGFLFVDRAPGHYRASVNIPGFIRSLSFTLDKGEERYIRIGIAYWLMTWLRFRPVLVDTDVGKREIAGTKFIGRNPREEHDAKLPELSSD